MSLRLPCIVSRLLLGVIKDEMVYDSHLIFKLFLKTLEKDIENTVTVKREQTYV